MANDDFDPEFAFEIDIPDESFAELSQGMSTKRGFFFQVDFSRF